VIHVRRAAVVTGGFVALEPGIAHAHLVTTRYGDFVGGMLHPLTALEHAVPLLALGLLAGLQPPPGARLIMYLVPAGLLSGMAIVLLFPAIDVVAFNRWSFIVLGLLVAFGRPLPDGLLAALGIVFSLSHGYENGLAMTPDMSRLLFGLGVALAGSAGVALVGAATLAVVRLAGGFRIAVRVAGSWIAAIGLMVIVV
jgi:urease accessory protein